LGIAWPNAKWDSLEWVASAGTVVCESAKRCEILNENT